MNHFYEFGNTTIDLKDFAKIPHSGELAKKRFI
jgi:hypothetical protein